MCALSGLAKVGVIAVEGTKLQANAWRNENLDYEQLARAISFTVVGRCLRDDDR